ncbi:MAG TPA: purine-nucleoside phosphorylase [Thermoanaerobaculia bacterium]|jgi:purine-nucleoside phosphorylase|nr:purine-nucleoside phosphorylase [Thermoanaerobaculia bacterium]HEV8609180.1 purine-nucleoside phosphorylase [Thermoanaerobaculia bacterium]
MTGETGLLGRLDATAEFLRGKRDVSPAVGLVLGSGLGTFASRLKNRVAIPYEEVPSFPVPSGVVGHAGELVLGDVGKTPVVVLSGRVHYYEGRPMTDVVFPVRVLARLGVRAVVLTNAAGGVRKTFKPGDLMLMTDHINAFGTNPLIGPNEDALGPRFPDMSRVYDPALRKLAKETARSLRIPLREGVYLGNSGPSYETPAEIRAYRAIGADAVGMSTVPEAIALNHAGVRVIGISTITNMAAGILPKPLDHSEVLATTKKVGDRFVRLLTTLVPKIGSAVRR